MSKLLLTLTFLLLPLSSFASPQIDKLKACIIIAEAVPGASIDAKTVVLNFLACTRSVTTRADGSTVSSTGCFGSTSRNSPFSILKNDAARLYWYLARSGANESFVDEYGFEQPEDINPRTGSIQVENFNCRLTGAIP